MPTLHKLSTMRLFVEYRKRKKQTTIKNKLIIDANYDDLTLQPGEDREFRNQFSEFLRQNTTIDDTVISKEKKERKKKTVRKSTLEYFL